MTARIAFVTGASRGIGKAIAARLLADGHKVAAGYLHHPEGVADLAGAFPVKVDVAERASIQEALAIIKADLGDVSILVNNAGIAQEKDFFSITDEDWDIMLGVNLRSNFALSQEVLPTMIEKGWGRIINISSIGGQWGGMNQVHYAAAKAAQINFTRSLAKLFSKNGITANALAVGLAKTDMTADELSRDDGKAKVAGIPVGRLADTSEIAAAVSFLASDDAAYVTGQTLNLNGGMYFD